MDSYTFGNSQAAVNLVGILSKPENQLYEHKAARILSKYQASIQHLRHIPDKETRETAYKLWRDKFIKWVDDSAFPTPVETHLKCVIVGEYRKWLRQIK